MSGVIAYPPTQLSSLEVGSPTGTVPGLGDVDISGAFKINGVPINGGSGAPITTNAVTANTSVATVPADSFLLYFLLRETAGHSVTVTIGTTSGGSDVVTSQVVPSSGTLTIPVSSMSKNWFSASATQALFLNSGSWGSASVNIMTVYQAGP